MVVVCALAMGAALAAPAQATTSLSSGYVTPTTGGNTTKFTWRVKFWNTAGVLPDAVKLAIWSTGTGTRWFTMWPLEPGDTNVVDGKWYTASMTLPARDRRDPRSDGGIRGEGVWADLLSTAPGLGFDSRRRP